MSTDNVELARSLFSAFRQGDVEMVLAHIDPDIEVHDAPEGMGGDEEIGLYSGRDSLFTNLLGEMQSVFSDFQIEAEEFIDTGDRLFAAVKIDGTGVQSGVHVEMRVYHVWTYENEVAKRLQIFNEREQALKVAGVHWFSEPAFGSGVAPEAIRLGAAGRHAGWGPHASTRNGRCPVGDATEPQPGPTKQSRAPGLSGRVDQDQRLS